MKETDKELRQLKELIRQAETFNCKGPEVNQKTTVEEDEEFSRRLYVTVWEEGADPFLCVDGLMALGNWAAEHGYAWCLETVCGSIHITLLPPEELDAIKRKFLLPSPSGSIVGGEPSD